MAIVRWNIPSKSKNNRYMKENEVSIRYDKGHNYALTFNASLSKVIQAEGYKYLDVEENTITKEIAFIISDEKGLPITEAGSPGCNNSVVSSKCLIEMLYERLKLPLETSRYIISLSEDLSLTSQHLYYRLKLNNYGRKSISK